MDINRELALEILSEFGIHHIEDCEYYLIELEKTKIYTYSRSKLNFFKYEKFIKSKGIPFLKIVKGNTMLLPGIIHIVQIEDEITLTNKQAHDFSYGKSMEIIGEDGIYMVRDTYKRKIGIAQISDSILIPLIDQGWYLREGA